MFKTWKEEFEQMHPNSFTVQKLNLINPVRRKYQLKDMPEKPAEKQNEAAPKASPVIPAVSKPVINPKPKFK